MTPRTPQCEVFWALLLSSEHSGVPEDSKSPTFPSVGLHPHTWPKWGCDTSRLLNKVGHNYIITYRKVLAMVYVLHKFKHFLLGVKFFFYVDHMALIYLINKP